MIFNLCLHKMIRFMRKRIVINRSEMAWLVLFIFAATVVEGSMYCAKLSSNIKSYSSNITTNVNNIKKKISKSTCITETDIKDISAYKSRISNDSKKLSGLYVTAKKHRCTVRKTKLPSVPRIPESCTSKCNGLVSSRTKTLNNIKNECKILGLCKATGCSASECNTFATRGNGYRNTYIAFENDADKDAKLCGFTLEYKFTNYIKEVADYCYNLFESVCSAPPPNPCLACSENCQALCDSCKFTGDCGVIESEVQPICLSCPGASPYCEC